MPRGQQGTSYTGPHMKADTQQTRPRRHKYWVSKLLSFIHPVSKLKGVTLELNYCACRLLASRDPILRSIADPSMKASSIAG